MLNIRNILNIKIEPNIDLILEQSKIFDCKNTSVYLFYKQFFNEKTGSNRYIKRKTLNK
jgi:hypothetical protein